jgi:hypothetical protein
MFLICETKKLMSILSREAFDNMKSRWIYNSIKTIPTQSREQTARQIMYQITVIGKPYHQGNAE